jgi:23S rRNA (cytidine2498-2'-O)-methyltransferase
VKFPAAAPAKPGEWLLTTRAAAEQDLLDELVLPPFGRDVALPRIAGPALVAVPALPKRDRPELTFARQGFPVAAVVPVADRDAVSRLARAIADALPAAQGRAAQARGPQPYSLDAWVPDDDRTNPQSGAAEQLAAHIARTLGEVAPSWPRAADARAAWTDNALCAQLCVSGELAYVGVLPAREMPSLAPGGRLRVHLPKHAPSRAAAKLLEAFAWLDRAPEPGELCADLGAAPGGWTWVLLERRARVLAIDPAKLDPVVAKRHGLTHLRADAFKYEPEGFVDWLVADMAWRPLEAAALYGKWGRRGWARMLVANIKLPMKKKAEYLLRIRDILSSSGWGHLRVRQLYHDRDEVTVGAVLATPMQGAY